MSVERTLESESLFNGNEENESVALDEISENRTVSVIGMRTQKQPTLKEILELKYISCISELDQNVSSFFRKEDGLEDLKKRHELDFGKNINRAVFMSPSEKLPHPPLMQALPAISIGGGSGILNIEY